MIIKCTGVENVKGKEGETVTLPFNTSTLEPVRQVTLQERDSGTVVSRNCSLEEKKSGCKENTTSPRIFVYIDNETVSVVFRGFTARDVGGYILKIVGKEVKNKSFNLTNGEYHVYGHH